MTSDLSGVVYTDNSAWQIQVLKELRELEFDMDLRTLGSDHISYTVYINNDEREVLLWQAMTIL